MKKLFVALFALSSVPAFAGTLTCQLEKIGSTGFAPGSKVIAGSKQTTEFKKNPYPKYADYMLEWTSDEYSYSVTVDESVNLTLTDLTVGAETWTSMEKNSKNFYQIMIQQADQDEGTYLRCSIK